MYIRPICVVLRPQIIPVSEIRRPQYIMSGLFYFESKIFFLFHDKMSKLLADDMKCSIFLYVHKRIILQWSSEEVQGPWTTDSLNPSHTHTSHPHSPSPYTHLHHPHSYLPLCKIISRDQCGSTSRYGAFFS